MTIACSSFETSETSRDDLVPRARPGLDGAWLSRIEHSRQQTGLPAEGADLATTPKTCVTTSAPELSDVHHVAGLAEMAGSIAHEINQPLAGILTNASACLRWLDRPEPELEEAKEALERITRDARRTVDIVTGLRSLFLRSTGRKAPQQIERLVVDVMDLTLPMAERATVVVRTCFASDLPAVHVDRVQMQQVLSNLVLNAIEAICAAEAAPRELVLATRALHTGTVQVEVRDSGIGFAHADSERLFEAFYSTKPNGMGLGLAISRAIVREHGGDLHAHPNAGACGATFVLELPAAASGDGRAVDGG